MLLFRRSDETTLKLALEMAEKSGNEEIYKAVLSRYNAFKNNKTEDIKEESAANESEGGNEDKTD